MDKGLKERQSVYWPKTGIHLIVVVVGGIRYDTVTDAMICLLTGA